MYNSKYISQSDLRMCHRWGGQKKTTGSTKGNEVRGELDQSNLF